MLKRAIIAAVLSVAAVSAFADDTLQPGPYNTSKKAFRIYNSEYAQNLNHAIDRVKKNPLDKDSGRTIDHITRLNNFRWQSINMASELMLMIIESREINLIGLTSGLNCLKLKYTEYCEYESSVSCRAVAGVVDDIQRVVTKLNNGEKPQVSDFKNVTVDLPIVKK